MYHVNLVELADFIFDKGMEGVEIEIPDFHALIEDIQWIKANPERYKYTWSPFSGIKFKDGYAVGVVPTEVDCRVEMIAGPGQYLILHPDDTKLLRVKNA